VHYPASLPSCDDSESAIICKDCSRWRHEPDFIGPSPRRRSKFVPKVGIKKATKLICPRLYFSPLDSNNVLIIIFNFALSGPVCGFFCLACEKNILIGTRCDVRLQLTTRSNKFSGRETQKLIREDVLRATFNSRPKDNKSPLLDEKLYSSTLFHPALPTCT
jgi:hypothetical protein